MIGIICSLLHNPGGRCEILGYDIDHDFPRAKACLGVVPRELNVNVFETPFQIVVNQAGYYGIPRPLTSRRTEQHLT